MKDYASSSRPVDGDDLRTSPAVPDAVATTETYEIDDGTVFYDADNPLAWIQTSEALALAEMA